MCPADRSSHWRWRQQGFSFFEMVVVISCIAFFYMAAVDRMSNLPAMAERASMEAVVAQVKAGLNLQMVTMLTKHGESRAQELQQENPMSFMLEAPGNYLGEVEQMAGVAPQPASWYFERSSRQLVYVIDPGSAPAVSVNIGGSTVMPGQLRFQVESAGNGGRWQGLVLQPVYPYQWQVREELPMN